MSKTRNNTKYTCNFEDLNAPVYRFISLFVEISSWVFQVFINPQSFDLNTSAPPGQFFGARKFQTFKSTYSGFGTAVYSITTEMPGSSDDSDTPIRRKKARRSCLNCQKSHRTCGKWNRTDPQLIASVKFS